MIILSLVTKLIAALSFLCSTPDTDVVVRSLDIESAVDRRDHGRVGLRPHEGGSSHLIDAGTDLAGCSLLEFLA